LGDQIGEHSYWQITAGGPDDLLSFHSSSAGDVMALASGGNLGGYTTLTLRSRPNKGVLGVVLEPDPGKYSWRFNVFGNSIDVFGNGKKVASLWDDGTLWVAGDLSVASNATCATLEIRGGMDIAEPFAMSEADLPEGAVVIIDDQHPGQLKQSERAYDTRVAGVVSGAGGISPGISLTQKGVLETGENVALSGRVYALADASPAPIRPGDLLTTSARPAHAMKASDRARAQGAILGKAMSSLAEGQGLVLVLVTLQ
jgi:hypothetical protein